MSCLTELLTCYISETMTIQTIQAQIQTQIPNLVDSIRSHLVYLDNYFDKFSQLHLTSIVLLVYLLLIAINSTPAKSKVAYAFFLSMAINYSPLYDALSNVQFYSLYSIIYLITARFVTNKKIKSTLVIMAIFEFTMAYDRYINAGVATWLYDSFEEITCLIHLLIISSSIRFKPICLGAILGRLAAALRGISHSKCITTGI